MFVDPNLETCCSCFNLADGSLLIGIVLLLHSVFCAIGSGYFLNLLKNSFDVKEEFNKYIPKQWPEMETLVITYLTFNCVSILFHLVLILGVQKDYFVLLKIWLIYMGMVIITIVIVIFLYHITRLKSFMVTIPDAVLVSILGYWWSVVFVYRREAMLL